ncbi:Putative ribonuclease H protein At1g65750 [Linum perenne]
MTPPCSDAGADLPIWGLEANGQYSVSSGYLIACEIDDDSDNRWKEIWRWEGPQRIRHFLWLAAQNKLLTNEERCRRHLATSDECGGCNSAIESVIHVVRDCPVAKEIWYELLCKFWMRLVATSFQEARNLRQSITTQRRITNVGWKAAEQQFATLNTDGSVRGRRGGAAAGGCMRNEEGRIIDAFACNLGRCSITRAELTGAVIGLERAWELGERKVEVQMDSSCAIKLLEGKLNLEHQHAGLVLRFKQLTERSWTIRLIFTGKVITWQIIWQTKVMI